MKNVYKFYLIDKTSDRYFDVKAIVKKQVQIIKTWQLKERFNSILQVRTNSLLLVINGVHFSLC